MLTGPTQSFLYQTLMQGVFDEAYIFDQSSMRLLAASESAAANHGVDLAGLQTKTFKALLGVPVDFFKRHLDALEKSSVVYPKTQPLKIHLSESQFNLFSLKSNHENLLIVIKNDATSTEAMQRNLRESEMRFQAIVSNTPSLVCQFSLDPEGLIQFDYLSGHSLELLGFDGEQLKQVPTLFYKMINPKDRSLLRMRLKLSSEELSQINWDGRVWIDAWQDTKWINMRATPRKLSSGDVQWDGFITNITQSMDEKFEIEESRRRLSELTAHMNNIREDERKKIACEIHDDLGGNLTAIKIGLASIMQQASAGQAINLDKLKHLDEIVDGTYAAVHRISRDLRPNIIELGIVAALEWQSNEFEKQYNIPCHFKMNEPEIEVTTEQALALFRICQEAMSNIAKYAKATQVEVLINQLKQDVEMYVIDNGVGIKPIDKLKDHSFGLRGMQERTAALNGSFKVSRLRAGKRGTQVYVKLPIRKP